jgi:uncharacterized membrane protein YfcA
MTVACTVHGSVGFGKALVAAPLLILIDPALIPAPIIVNAMLLLILMIIREPSAVAFREVSWAVIGSVFGTAVATGLLVVIPNDAFELVFGIMLLGIVAISLVRWSGEPSTWMSLGAGVLSGLMGTTTSIGGPPMALAFQNATAPRLRATLSVYFLVGAVFALGGLAIAGRFGMAELKLAAYLVPGTLMGLLISNWTRSWLRRDLVRPAVLLLSTVAAMVVLIRFFA